MDKKKSSQLGISAIWDGPYESPQSSLKPGNSRNHMEVLKSPTPYKAGPISSLAKG